MKKLEFPSCSAGVTQAAEKGKVKRDETGEARARERERRVIIIFGRGNVAFHNFDR